MTNIVSEEILDKAKKWLLRQSKTWNTGCTRGQAWSTGGKYLAGEHYDACHAWVQHAHSDLYGTAYTYGDYNTKISKNKNEHFLVLTCHSKTRTKSNISPEAHDAFILWLAGPTSPFSKYILNRDDPESLCNGGAVILVGPQSDASLAEAMWICKVLRYPTENGCSLEVWYGLYQAGVDPILAIAVCGLYSKKENNYYIKDGGNGHCHVFSYYNDGIPVSCILSNKPPETNASSTFLVLGSKEECKDWAALNKELDLLHKTTTVSDGWGGKQTFKGSSLEDIIKAVLETQKGIRK